MAVAVKNNPEIGSGSPFDRLAVASLVGIVYVLGCLGIVFGLLPALCYNVLGWSTTSLAASSTLGVLMFAAAIALLVTGNNLLSAKTHHGVRAGTFVGLVGLVAILLLTRWASLWIEHWAYDGGTFKPAVGQVIVAIIGLSLLALGLRLFFRAESEKLLIQLEDQGWFSAVSYKPLQGQRVRRGTILGILLLAGAGIYTLVSHGTLKRGSENWELNVPFTGKVTVDDTVKVTNAGDSTKLKEGMVVGRAEFDAERKALETLQRRPLTGIAMPISDARASLEQLRAGFNPGDPVVLDRYDFRDLAAKYDSATHVRVLLAGESKYKEGDVVSKAEFEATRKDMQTAGKSEPVATVPEPPTGTTEFRKFTLLPSVQFTVPLLILAGSLWLAWRIVNYPTFADFLIATEAEINKVSWTTRKRLVQDTIVVLVTVVLMSGFLFGTDQLWRVLLSSRVVNVLQFPDAPTESANRDRPPW